MPTSKWWLGVALWSTLLPRAIAGTPDWFREAARMPTPTYSEETRAVVLLSEQTTTVKDSGEINTVYRRVVKVLRPQGRDQALIAVFSDNETRIGSLKAWGINSQGQEFEVKEKDAVETGLSEGVLYADTRKKSLQIPAAEPGAVIGYEYQQKRRPFVLEDSWLLQEDIPVVLSRFSLRLPTGWEFKTYWSNHDAIEPQALGQGQWNWQLQNLPAIEEERLMPPREAVAGWVSVHYYPSQNGQGTSAGSWEDIARWYSNVSNGRRQPTPEIQQKVAQLTSGLTTQSDKIKALSSFVQRDVRYVEIKIGIGGFQPHTAQDVFSNRYGDCKDKVTLLSAMLQVIGVDSYYVLINSTRGITRPSVPSIAFDHVILAVRLPRDASDADLYAAFEDPQLGRILFFDPTDQITPFGALPSSLQANYGLVITEKGGELVQLPLLAPSLNRFLRSAQLTLSSDGTLSGTVQEIRQGYPAVLRRAELLRLPESERKRFFENVLASSLGGFTLVDYQIEGLDNSSESLVLRYRFFARNYAKSMGGLLLVRPRVLGQKSDDVMEGKKRQYPVEFGHTSLESDLYDITLPPGYAVDELPSPANASFGFGKYKSQLKVQGSVLHYQRDYEIDQVEVPVDHLADLKVFFRCIAEDESNTAVLKKVN